MPLEHCHTRRVSAASLRSPLYPPVNKFCLMSSLSLPPCSFVPFPTCPGRLLPLFPLLRRCRGEGLASWPSLLPRRQPECPQPVPAGQAFCPPPEFLPSSGRPQGPSRPSGIAQPERQAGPRQGQTERGAQGVGSAERAAVRGATGPKAHAGCPRLPGHAAGTGTLCPSVRPCALGFCSHF